MFEQLLELVLELIVGVIATAITVVLFQKYMEKKRSYQLLWGVGMLLWAVTAFTQAYSLEFGWPVWMYLLYFFSAIALAGFLGAGTLGLVAPNHKLTFKLYVAFNIICSLILIYELITAQVNQAELALIVVGGLALPNSINIISTVINIPALVTFVGGAAYSYIRTRMRYALMITIGALIPAIGGTLAAAAQPWVLPFTDFIGILFLGYGFWLTFNMGSPKATNIK